MTRLSGWHCHACGNELTDEEHRFYHDRCEGCERAWLERVKAWREGAPDPALYEAYDEIQTIH